MNDRTIATGSAGVTAAACLAESESPVTAKPLASAGADLSPVTVGDQVLEAEWDTYVRSHGEGTIDHRWRWRHVFADVFGHDSVYLAARRNNRIVGVLPLVRFRSRLFGRSLVSVPFLNYGGVLASDSAAVTALVEQAIEVGREFGATHVELRHQTPQTSFLPHRQHKLQLRRTLPSTSEALWAQTDKKVRNQVRKAQKDGLTATHGGAELVDAFYTVFATNMRDLGTPVYSKRLFAETLRLFAGDARIFVVWSGRIPVAAGVTVRHLDTTLVPWASSLRAYRQHCPNMLLYWTMLETSALDGVRVFDFGRSSPGSGTHQFKRQWGAEERPLRWEYALLSRAEAPDHGPQNPRFSPLIDAWKRLPLWMSNRIGPWIVKNIP